MRNFSFLQKYQKLQYTIMFDALIDLGYAMVGYSETDPYAFWNLALTDIVLGENQISKIEDILKGK